MNKKQLPVIAAIALLALSGCSSKKDTVIDTIEEAYAAFASNNATVEADGFSITQYFGGNAFFKTFTGDYASYGNIGYLINGDEGIYPFTIDSNGIVEMGNIAYSEAKQSIINMLDYNVLDLMELGANVWTKNEDGSYTTTNEETLDMMGYLNGNSYNYGSDMKDVKLTVVDGVVTFTSTVDFSEEYGTDDYNFVCKVVISNLGTTHNTAVENIIANPIDMKGLSEGLNDVQKQTVKKYAGEELPNLAWTKKSGFSDDDTSVTLYDLSIGNKVEEYGALLLSSGWTLDNSYHYSGMDEEYNYIEWQEGDAEWYYEAVYYKDVTEGEELKKEYVVDVLYYTESYLNDTYYTNEYTGTMPNGYFGVSAKYTEFHNATELANELASLTFEDEVTLPTFSWTSNPYSIAFSNYDEEGQAWGACICYDRQYIGFFADEATAIAQLKIAESALVSAGFIVYNDGENDYTVDNIPTTGYSAVYDYTFTSYNQLEVQLNYASDGSFSITVIY